MTEKDVYKKGVALLEEWEDVNYCEHSFKFKDEWLTDKEVVDLLNELHDENTKLKEHQNINCQNCQYFVSDSASSDCLKREDIGYKGICIDGMDLHKLAKNCPYYY